MKIVNITTFRKLFLGNKHNIGAIDMGTSNCGLAMADSTKTSVTARGTIERGYPRLEEANLRQFGQSLQKFVVDHKIAGIVFGLPLTLEGDMTQFCDEIIQIAEFMPISCNGIADMTAVDNPDNHVVCTFWDERHSTGAAKSTTQRFSKRRSVVMKYKDSMAACMILKSFINQ